MNRRPALSNDDESNFKRLKMSLKQTRFSPQAKVRNFTRNSIVGTKSNTTRPSNRHVNTLRNRNRNPGLNIDPFNDTVYYGEIRQHSNNTRAKHVANVVSREGTDQHVAIDAAKNAMIAHIEAQNAYGQPKDRRLRFSEQSFSRDFNKNKAPKTVKNAANRAVYTTNRIYEVNPGPGVRFSNGTQRWGNVRSHNQNRAKKRAAFNAEYVGTNPSYLTAAYTKATNLSNELAKSNNMPESSGGRRRTRKALRH